MKKLAIFVEGQTEQIFIEQLLIEIAGRNRVLIETRRAFGGRRQPRVFETVEGSSIDSGEKFYVLIFNCGTDGKVAGDIRDRFEGLSKQGYSGIIGIRDVAPLPASRIAELRTGLLRMQRSTSQTDLLFVLAVMEIEAWFLAEHGHFVQIDPQLTLEKIKSSLGFNPETDDMSLRPAPAKDLQDIYWLANLLYEKRKQHALRTISSLDYARIYCELGERFPDLKTLLKRIDNFLTVDSAA